MNYRSLDELSPAGKRVLMRVDFNSPVDPTSGRILDDKRLRGHVESIEYLSESALVLITHQSRPGKNDFTTMEGHAKRLERILGREVKYIDDIFGSKARETIEGLERGDILLLENARFYSEEYIEMEPKKAATTHEIEKLAPLFDAYVNDAFSAAHRSQPSIVGFPEKLPSYAGFLMEEEVEILGGIEDSEKPRVFALGGAKAEDGMRVIENVFADDRAEKVLVSGVTGNIFLMAEEVYLGEPTEKFIQDQGYLDLVDRAREILDKYGDSIELPVDIAVEIEDERREIGIEELPSEGQAFDIGIETIVKYSSHLEEAGTAVVNGPPGVYEEEPFSRGTREVFNAATRSGFSVAGGGDTSAAIDTLNIDGFDHVSSGGGASLAVLSGDELPALKALGRRN